ncbi:MAG: polyprenyl synthetase family protein [bacterium]|nr:MAG: polyprenyl synthetase family protein [bacterium]
MQVKEFEKQLQTDREMIGRRLAVLLPSEQELPVSLHSAMRYATLGGGKRLRGILCCASHRLFGDPYPQGSLDAACALEILHAYTLIHDDLPSLDDDDLRRGKPSCHVRFGEATAILAGDALQARAFEVLARTEAPQERVLGSLRILAQTAGSLYLVGGQVADLEGEGKTATPELVDFIHLRKTAQLIAASLGIGACLAGCGAERLTGIMAVGRKVGYAFQIVDDILDIEGSEDLMGKGLRKDSKRGKITHPAVFGIDGSRRVVHELIEESVAAIRDMGDAGYLGQLFSLIGKRVS